MRLKINQLNKILNMETRMSLASQSSTNSERNDKQLSAMRDKNSKSHGSSIVSAYPAIVG